MLCGHSWKLGWDVFHRHSIFFPAWINMLKTLFLHFSSIFSRSVMAKPFCHCVLKACTHTPHAHDSTALPMPHHGPPVCAPPRSCTRNTRACTPHHACMRISHMHAPPCLHGRDPKTSQPAELRAQRDSSVCHLWHTCHRFTVTALGRTLQLVWAIGKRLDLCSREFSNKIVTSKRLHAIWLWLLVLISYWEV